MSEEKNTNTDKQTNSEKFAVVEVKGTQLKVFEGKKYEVDFMEGEKGSDVVLDKVLLFSDGKKTSIGKPYLEKVKVHSIIDSQKKGEKIDGLIYKAKARYRKRYGHRALVTRLLIKEIGK